MFINHENPQFFCTCKDNIWNKIQKIGQKDIRAEINVPIGIAICVIADHYITTAYLIHLSCLSVLSKTTTLGYLGQRQWWLLKKQKVMDMHHVRQSQVMTKEPVWDEVWNCQFSANSQHQAWEKFLVIDIITLDWMATPKNLEYDIYIDKRSWM